MVSPLESAGSIPLAILGVGLLLAASWGIGGLLNVSPAARLGRPEEAAVLRVVLGLNLVALCGLLAGVPGWLADGRSIWLLAGLSLLAGVRAWRSRGSRTVGSRFGRHVRPGCRPRLTSLMWLPMLLTLGPALCYPTGWDELVYHHELPRRWLAAGHPAFFPDLPYSGFPSLGEILFWLVAPVESVITPRLLNWLCWMLGLVMLNLRLRHWLSRGLSNGLTAVFAASPAVLMISANCYVEAILLMNVAAILLATASRPRTGDHPADAGRALGSDPSFGQALSLGILAGGAAGVKLTGLAVLPFPLLWYGTHLWQRRASWRNTGRRALICLAAAVFVGLPFYLRPWAATGNPVYPYFAHIFTDDPVKIDVSRYHHAIGGARFGLDGAVGVVSGPVLLAFDERLYDGSFGWQWLGILALAAVAVISGGRPTRGLVLWPALVAATLYAFWALTAQQARFAVPVVLAAVVVSSLGLRRLSRMRRRLALVVLAIAAVVSLPWQTAGYYFGSWESVVGYWTWTEYVDDGTDYTYVPLVQAIDELTPRDARLMLLFEHRGMYVPRPHVIGTPSFQQDGLSPAEAFSDPEVLMQTLRRNGITHLVMTRSPVGPDHPQGWSERFEPLLRSIGECVRRGDWAVVWESPAYLIFELVNPSA